MQAKNRSLCRGKSILLCSLVHCYYARGRLRNWLEPRTWTQAHLLKRKFWKKFSPMRFAAPRGKKLEHFIFFKFFSFFLATGWKLFPQWKQGLPTGLWNVGMARFGYGLFDLFLKRTRPNFLYPPKKLPISFICFARFCWFLLNGGLGISHSAYFPIENRKIKWSTKH